MKSSKPSVKTFLSNLLLGALAMYGGSWLGFLAAMVPLYIVRGAYHDMETLVRVERSAAAAVALPVTCLFLILLYRRGDDAARADRTTILTRAVGASVLCGLVSLGNNTVFSPSGYYLASAIDPSKDGPGPVALLVTAVVTTALFAGAVYLGYFLARRKHAKEREAMTGHTPD